MNQERGRQILIEGTDGTGKTTVANLVADRLRDQGREVIRVDEPDSAKNEAGDILVPIAGEIRGILKNGALARSALTNALLFTAQRRENWLQAIEPAIAAGTDVVKARDYLSTLVYQGYGEGFSRPTINLLTRFAVGRAYMNPDFTFILDLDDEKERLRRIESRGELGVPDTFESMDDAFQQRLIDGYRAIARKKRIKPIMATRPPDEIADSIISRLV